MQHNKECCHKVEKEKISLNPKLIFSLIALLVIWGVSHLSIFRELNAAIVSYFSIIWWAVLLGLLIGGIIDYFVPRGFIFKYLGKRGFRSLIYSVVAGFAMSACSHGILAIAIQLYKKGAGIPSVVTFLLASPWANLPVTVLLFSFFGVKALLIILSAMSIALATGAIFMLLEKNRLIESSPAVEIDENYQWDKLRNFELASSLKGVSVGAINLANMVLWWIIVGFLIAVLIKAYLPHSVFHSYLGADFFGLIGTLLVATIIEVCSEGSAPIAFELHSQVGTLGNPFVFLMAGVVTDYTEIGLLWSNIGRRTAIWLPIIAVPQVLFIGYLMNNMVSV